jgi:hydroxymethylpyrimidine/phosphomethylpyrimidine kinase
MTTEKSALHGPALPVAMTIAGHDPGGGAGIQADIESMISMGCHACSVVTALTVQDTSNVYSFMPVEPEMVIQQARTLLEDMPVHAIKIGMLASTDIVEAVQSVLIDYPEIPVVVDPVMASGEGDSLSERSVREAIIELLLPYTTILTPNTPEARELAPESDNLDACAMSLLDHGCKYVLITGTHEQTEQVKNTFYGGNQKLDEFSWPRLEGSYHGSGCTLAAAIAGLLAQGKSPAQAVLEGQEFTWQALLGAYRIGMGQKLPNRFFWAGWEENEDKS